VGRRGDADRPGDADQQGDADRQGDATGAAEMNVPRFPLVVVAFTLGGFAVTSFAGASPVWAACAGTAVLAVHALRHRYTSARRMINSAGLLFCLFVLALGIVVKAVVDHGLGRWLAGIPALAGPGAGSGRGAPTLLALLAVAGLAAGLANVINNLPAVLALLPVAAAHVATAGPGLVLAVLIGVNLGPNLTYAGSLATLLWRRALNEHGTAPRLALFTRLGLLAAPATLGAATVGLWAALQVLK
jgi:arsenical pump membrane protein